jgi:hypothetical protein
MKKGKKLLSQLFQERERLILEGKNINKINRQIEEVENDYSNWISEDVSAAGGVSSIGVGGGGVAYGNASIGGSGAITSPQPSSYSGVTTEPGYSAGGGFDGTSLSIPYNAAPKKVFQKETAARFGSNKRRHGKEQAKIKAALQAMKSKRMDFTAGQGGAPKFPKNEAPKGGKIMSWDNFQKDKMTQVTPVKESFRNIKPFGKL